MQGVINNYENNFIEYYKYDELQNDYINALQVINNKNKEVIPMNKKIYKYISKKIKLVIFPVTHEPSSCPRRCPSKKDKNICALLKKGKMRMIWNEVEAGISKRHIQNLIKNYDRKRNISKLKGTIWQS